MPIYEFECKKCKKQFELIVFSGDIPECPYCKNKDITKRISTFNAHNVGPGPASSKSGESCNTCISKNCSTCK
jgi:putative FmdB family regulatory protein